MKPEPELEKICEDVLNEISMHGVGQGVGKVAGNVAQGAKNFVAGAKQGYQATQQSPQPAPQPTPPQPDPEPEQKPSPHPNIDMISKIDTNAITKEIQANKNDPQFQMKMWRINVFVDTLKTVLGDS